jgi:hypothetical protein
MRLASLRLGVKRVRPLDNRSAGYGPPSHASAEFGGEPMHLGGYPSHRGLALRHICRSTRTSQHA